MTWAIVSYIHLDGMCQAHHCEFFEEIYLLHRAVEIGRLSYPVHTNEGHRSYSRIASMCVLYVHCFVFLYIDLTGS